MPDVLRGPAAALLSVIVAFFATHLSWPLLRATPMAFLRQAYPVWDIIQQGG